MTAQSLAQLVIFCGAILIPLSFTALFTVGQYEKYAEENDREHLYLIVTGIGLVTGCVLFLASAIGMYLTYEQLGMMLTVIASGVVLLSAMLMGGVAVRMKQKTGEFKLP